MSRLEIRAVPNASRTEITGWVGDALKVKVKAVPEGGRANAEITRFMADLFGVPRNGIKIVAGEKSRNKIVEIALPEEAVKGRLPLQMG